MIIMEVGMREKISEEDDNNVYHPDNFFSLWAAKLNPKSVEGFPFLSFVFFTKQNIKPNQKGKKEELMGYTKVEGFMHMHNCSPVPETAS